MNQNDSNYYENNHVADAEYSIYCDALEEQYEAAKENGVFEILKLLELDKKNSSGYLVEAVDYFNSKNGLVEKDAPTDFLTERDKKIINQDGKFRPHLYSMFLSQYFSEAIQNKTAFITHSYKYAFDGQ